MSRDYPRLSIQDFGAHLLRTGDLDPVYTALVNAGWTGKQLCQWLVAYWCFYDCGFASYVCDLDTGDYWAVLKTAAENDPSAPSPLKGGRWPRGKERRHFRGAQGINAIKSMSERYPENETMVDYVMAAAPDYKAVAKRVQEHVGFGPWIAFKVADMLERVLNTHVDFTEAAVFMFKDPKKAAVMYHNQKLMLPLDTEHTPHHVKTNIIPDVVKELICHFQYHPTPGVNRFIDLQEVETILCKWKSHMNGHYPLNNDIIEIREGLLNWAPHTENAADMLAVMPEEGP